MFDVRCCIQSVLIAVILCVVGPARADEPVVPESIFLLIGQSNMAGRAPLEPGDDAPLPNVQLLNAEGQWEPATSPLNRYATDRKVLSMQRIGPGDGFARRLHELRPDLKIGLIVNARGGTKIEEWGADQKLYVNALARVNKLPQVKIAGVLWHQGEGNSKDPEYFAKLKDLVTRLRTDLNDPELPFIAGKVYGDVPVNAQMSLLPQEVPRTAVVSADELQVFDGVHFDRASQYRFGARYAEAWVKLVEKPASPPSDSANPR